MRTMSEYIERAKLRAVPSTHEGLARTLGVSKTMIHQYKNNFSFPSEDVMILLGLMAGEQPGQSIIDLMNLKALHKSNAPMIRRVSIINEHLGVDDTQYKASKSKEVAVWNTR